MKKIIVSIIAACALLFGGIAIGESINGSYNGNPIVKVLAGGKTLTDEVPAQIIDGKTMVPLTMLRSLGFDVTWHGDDYSVTVQKPLTDEDIARISKSVGLVYVYKDGKSLAQGSGFVIDAAGGKVFVTNFHVGGIGDELRVTLDGKSYVLKNPIFAMEKTDVYGVWIDTDVPGLKMNTGKLNYGDHVVAIGYPKAKYSATKGEIDSLGSVIGFNAVVNNGSSGGALINTNGEVIGITTANHPGSNALVLSDAEPIQHVLDELNK